MTEIARARRNFEESGGSPARVNQQDLHTSTIATDPMYVRACDELMDTMSKLLADAYGINVVTVGSGSIDPIHLKKHLTWGNCEGEKDPYIFMHFILSDGLQDARKSGLGHKDLTDFLKAYNACSPDEDPVQIRLEDEGFRLMVRSGHTASLSTIYGTLGRMTLRHPHLEEYMAGSLDSCAAMIERLRGGPKGRVPACRMH